MTSHAGVWIDHRKAVVVTVAGDHQATRVIESNVEPHVRYSGGAASGSGEDTRERRFANELHKYYDDVVASMRDAEAIVIFGPGEAGGELRKRFEHAGLGARVLDVETTDKMTDPEIAAKVRKRFA